MVSIFFLILGIIDTVSALIIISGNTFLGELAYYLGIILLLKGIWTVITSLF